MTTRREFLAGSAALGAGALLTTTPGARAMEPEELFTISLAQWSLHRAIRGGDVDHLDFAKKARAHGIDAIEYVNQFFMDRAADFDYLAEMKRRAAGEGVASLLIMCDGEGALAEADAGARRKAIENHFKWAVAARYLGCHSIRVNAAGKGEYDEQMKLAADSLNRLAALAEPYAVNVIVENHGELSSNGAWLAGVMKLADNPRVGTLPDFGNFQTGAEEWYDRYTGVAEMMPFAKAVSAKSHAFDAQGSETHTDYRRMLKLVVAAGYRGRVGIEYEGDAVAEDDGIRLTKALLERVRAELT
jgi:sugar phosphate isomerase/epimerase